MTPSMSDAEPQATTEAGAQTLAFQAEVGRLLEIVATSLYSHPEIFLRELISNAADACDKLRYAALTRSELAGDTGDFGIRISVDAKAKTVTIADNGIGMNRDDMVENLGTIAKSGTAAFMQTLADSAAKGEKPDVTQIGQFGVGFYSAFMVADDVRVLSRKAGEADAWEWRSDGRGTFSIAPGARADRGTSVTLHLKKDAKEFLDRARIGQVVRRYADHVSLPIELVDGDNREAINAGSALWRRSASEIDEEQYAEFYRMVAGAFDAPWLTLHNRAEGRLEYTNLLFVPSSRPFDLFDPERRNRVRLCVKRVFITDDCPELLPAYLRFLRGVVDVEDLPLNISREMLQANPIVARIRSALVRRVLGALKRKADKEPDAYATFWKAFGAVLKEGLYEDKERTAELLGLARFASTAADEVVDLAGYKQRMVEGQAAIYYISGDNPETVAGSPQLEGFRARGVEVLLLSDPVDDFWLSGVSEYDGTPFVSVTRGAADLSGLAKRDGDAAAETDAADAQADAEAEDATKIERLLAMLKLSLQDSVKDVRASERLTESPVCLVADDGDIDLRLERMLRQHQQASMASQRILEVNPAHALIRKLADAVGQPGAEALIEDAGLLLVDQARIVEGEPLPDPAAFSRRLSRLVERGLG